MRRSIFEYRDYKDFLRESLEARGEKGGRTRLAEAAECHTAYISLVLNGDNHFSPEQGERIGRHFGLSTEQIEFFLLLIHLARASTATLKKIYEKQITTAVEAQLHIKNRISFQRALSHEDQITFYSSWHYGAVHVLVSVPGCNSEQGIAEYLGLPIQRISEVLQFLLSIGLVVRKGDRFDVGASHIHLASDAPMVSNYHANWRIRTIQSLDMRRDEDLHYSSVITASRADSPRIREILVRAIEEVRALVKASGNDDGYFYSIDFFGLRR